MKNKILALKSELEVKLKKDVRKWHKKIVAKSVAKVRRFGTAGVYRDPIDQQDIIGLEQLLKRHYDRAEKLVTPKKIRNKSKYNEINQVRNVIEYRIDGIKDTRGKISAEKIIETTRKYIVNVAVVADQTAKDSDLVDKTSLSRIFRKLLIKKLTGAGSGITITETNWIVEDGRKIVETVISEQMGNVGSKWISKYTKTIVSFTKSVEDDEEYAVLLILADSSDRENAEQLVERLKTNVTKKDPSTATIVVERMLNLKKKWNDIGDSHTRTTHRMAGASPAIPLNEPFLVGGSMLMYPSDTSLGANLDEIIGCRCYLTYS